MTYVWVECVCEARLSSQKSVRWVSCGCTLKYYLFGGIVGHLTTLHRTKTGANRAQQHALLQLRHGRDEKIYVYGNMAQVVVAQSTGSSKATTLFGLYDECCAVAASKKRLRLGLTNHITARVVACSWTRSAVPGINNSSDTVNNNPFFQLMYKQFSL